MKEKQKTSKLVPTGIYERVSTEDQAQEGFSIKAQIDKLKSYALVKEWEIYDIYADEGISGKNIVDRPAINRLIDDIENGKVKNVLVFKVDRLTRSTKNLIELVELFEENNCTFNSLTESIDTDTPSGRMFLKIIGIFAEFERENLSARTKLGFERKAKEGYTLANNIISYGYTKEKGQKVQEILPDEAQILKEIFSMYVDENFSMTKIAKTLNQRKIPTKMNVGSWDVSTIKLMLINPTYIGKVRYSMNDENKYFEAEGHHERIISDELFYSAREKMKNMANISKTKRPNVQNYFCGVLSCERCGSKFSTHHYKLKSGDNKCTYRCNKNSTYKNDDDVCKSPEISHDKVDTAFIEYINNINDLTEFDDMTIEDTRAKKERELLDYITDCERKIGNLNTQKKKVMEQYVNQEIAFEDYKKLMIIFNEKYEVLENEIHRVKTEIPDTKQTFNVQKDDIILSVKENWDYLNDKEKAMFLQTFIKKIVVKIERERPKFNVVEIKDVEFNLSAETPLKQFRKERANKGRIYKATKKSNIKVVERSRQ